MDILSYQYLNGVRKAGREQINGREKLCIPVLYLSVDDGPAVYGGSSGCYPDSMRTYQIYNHVERR